MAGDILAGVTDRAIGSALTGLSTRQKHISNNLANIDTPEYKASGVRFEDQLQSAIAVSRNQSPLIPVAYHPRHIPLEASRVEDVEPEVEEDEETATRVDGNNVDVDKEMVQLAETALTFNALVQITSARLSLTRYLVNDGRR